MNDNVRSRLEDTLVAAELIQSWVPHHSLKSITDDTLVESAFLLQFVRIGETLRIVRDADDELAESIPNIHKWISLRHHLVHDYREIDLELLWTSSVEAIPVLIGDLKRVLL